MDEATAPQPKSSPRRAGPRPSLALRNNGSTGSSIVSVAEIATTTAAQTATGGDRRTARTGNGSVSAIGGGTSSQTNASAPSDASPATSRNGARMPPASYIQPPIEGPTMNATL